MLRSFRGRQPAVAASAYVDPSAQVIGEVHLGERASIWANVTIRADISSVTVGADSNIQDNSCVHEDDDKPTVIGERVVIGHSCTIHGCTIGDDCLIGMGSTILNGAKVGAGSIVAAGSLVLERQEIPPRSMVMGSPAKIRRQTSDEELERVRRNAQNYVDLSREYMRES